MNLSSNRDESAIALTRLFIVLVFILFSCFTSYLSYYHKDWNSAVDILEEYFETKKWAAFANFQFDTRLAARVQLAMVQIEHMTHLIHK